MKITKIKNLIKSTAQSEVTFTKACGEVRVMLCTTQASMIPADFAPKGDSKVAECKDVVRVFDLEKNAWRSFRVDSVTKIVSMTEEGEVLDVNTVFTAE